MVRERLGSGCLPGCTGGQEILRVAAQIRDDVEGDARWDLGETPVEHVGTQLGQLLTNRSNAECAPVPLALDELDRPVCVVTNDVPAPVARLSVVVESLSGMLAQEQDEA